VSPPPVSRRALLEGTAGAGFVAAAGWGSAALRPHDAHAADPAQGAWSARQIATFRIRQAAAQAHLDEQEPVHRSNGDEGRYSDKRASLPRRCPTMTLAKWMPEVAQKRANDLLAQCITRAAHSSGRVA
jgi:hypothetical protein